MATAINHPAYKVARERYGQAGGNIFKSIWKGMKKGFNWAKDKKIISNIANTVGRVASIIPHPLAQGIGATAGKVGNVAGTLGMGHAGRGQTGMGILTNILGMIGLGNGEANEVLRGVNASLNKPVRRAPVKRKAPVKRRKTKAKK
jgi:hypothetical protein